MPTSISFFKVLFCYALVVYLIFLFVNYVLQQNAAHYIYLICADLQEKMIFFLRVHLN